MQTLDATPIDLEAQFICGITRKQVRVRNACYGLFALVALASVAAAAMYLHGDLKTGYARWAFLTCWLWVLVGWTCRDASLRARENWKRSRLLAEMLSPMRWASVRIRTCCPCDAGCTKPSCFRTDFVLSMDREPEAQLYLDGHPILHETSLRLSAEEVARLKTRRL
jgi:hypothetical protein